MIHLDYRWTHPLRMSDHRASDLVRDANLRELFAVLVTDADGDRLAREYVAATLSGVCGNQHLNVFVRRELAAEYAAAGFTIGN